MAGERETVRDILTDFSGMSRNDADHLAGMIVAAIVPGVGAPCQHCHWTEGHHRDCPYS
jgi:hypothetical protein